MMTNSSAHKCCTEGQHPASSHPAVMRCMQEEAAKHGLVLKGAPMTRVSNGVCMMMCCAGMDGMTPGTCTVVAAACLEESGGDCRACVCCTVAGACMV